MLKAKEARKLSNKSKKKIDWYNNASRALGDAMALIESATERGEYNIKVAGMDDAAAEILRSYGYTLKQEKYNFREWHEKTDGSWVRVDEYTIISW